MEECSVFECWTAVSLHGVLVSPLFFPLWECIRPVSRTAASHLNCSDCRITHLLLQDRAGKHNSNRHWNALQLCRGQSRLVRIFWAFVLTHIQSTGVRGDHYFRKIEIIALPYCCCPCIVVVKSMLQIWAFWIIQILLLLILALKKTLEYLKNALSQHRLC